VLLKQKQKQNGGDSFIGGGEGGMMVGIITTQFVVDLCRLSGSAESEEQKL
jgi:hypothetical protein